MLKSIARWLKNHQIVFCALCKKAIFHKDAHYEMTDMGISVPLCGKCYIETFHPFTKGE